MTPIAHIDAIGARQTIELIAIVDTGFDGDLCIPTRVAVQLGPELTGELDVELADGTRRKQLVFAGSVICCRAACSRQSVRRAEAARQVARLTRDPDARSVSVAMRWRCGERQTPAIASSGSNLTMALIPISDRFLIIHSLD
jgi:hypothetical protein